MTPTAQQAPSIGERLAADETIQSSIDAIIEQIRSQQELITGVRGPQRSLEPALEEALRQAADSRGRPLMYPYVGSGLGNGALVELIDGSVKYDMTCGIGPNFFGHSDPDLLAVALRAATSDVVMQGHLQHNADAIMFTKTLVGEAGRRSSLKHAFLCNSGAMANDNAWKIVCQKNRPANRLLAFSHSFAGRTVAMSQVGDSAGNRDGLPITMHVDYVPFYDEALAAKRGAKAAIDVSIKRLSEHLTRYPKQHAAFVFELVQGEGGFNAAPREFFTALMDLCREHSVAVWIDEVQTFGRTLEMFAFEALDLGEYVDVCTVGKMTQVCAALMTERYTPQAGLLSGTFLGSSVALQVGRRIIERLRDGGHYGDSGSIAAHHEEFRSCAAKLVERHPDWFTSCDKAPEPFGGFGGMMRLTPCGGDKARISKLCRTMFDVGVIALICGHGPHHVRMLPPLGVMRTQEWDDVFSLIETALERAADEENASVPGGSA